jgi:hypothetical protein
VAGKTGITPGSYCRKLGLLYSSNLISIIEGIIEEGSCLLSHEISQIEPIELFTSPISVYRLDVSITLALIYTWISGYRLSALSSIVFIVFWPL